MADLTDIESAQSVKVVGSTLSGAETHPLAIDSSGAAKVLIANYGADGGGESTELPLGDAPVEIKAGGSARANRRVLIIQGKGRGIKWGFSPELQPFDLFNKQTLMLPIGSDTSVWASAPGTQAMIAVGEVS